MSETKGLLEELDGKVSQLLLNIKGLKANSAEKDQAIESLKSELQEKNQMISSLNQERDELKKVSSGANQDELKDKIVEMVKEIDRCISLLKV